MLIGKFQLSVSIPNHAIKAKSLLLQVSYVGYKQVFHPISISSKSSSYELGDINLTQESYALDEAVVVGQAPMAVTEGGYNGIQRPLPIVLPKAQCLKNW